MTFADRIQRTRLKHARATTGQGIWRLYAGMETLTEVLNVDGSTPYIRQLKIGEAMQVAALSGVVEDVEFWLARHIGEALTLNQQWVISLDGGATGFRVQAVHRRVKAAKTPTTEPAFEYTLKGNSSIGYDGAMP